MAKGQNKNKPFQKRRINGSSTIDNEYDLEKIITRINSYSRTLRNSKDKFHSNITDSGERDGISSYGNGVIETPHTSSNRQRTGDYVAWDSYTRLDDKITDFSNLQKIICLILRNLFGLYLFSHQSCATGTLLLRK